MKQAYKDIQFREDTLAVIAKINATIDAYTQQGFTLSVRQLYYQLVAADEIENTERSYKRVASIINDGRLAGLIDWDAIEDRNRDIERRSAWESGSSIVRACADSFHMDMWDNQDWRVFVIVEKAALAGVLGGVCRQYDVPLLAARGYPSVSIVRELALEYLAPALERGQSVKLLHLGDHDPSGIDMTRDLEERLAMFVGEDLTENFYLDRVALNLDQIHHYSPPPNPAKLTDSRAEDYVRRFGRQSWELDALEPSVMVELVESEVLALRDPEAWDSRQDEIDATRDKLRATAREYEKRGD